VSSCKEPCFERWDIFIQGERL